MNIVCLGGGPAGLYLAISMKLRDPSHKAAVYERNKPGDTFGWGVVFSDQTLENLQANDPVSAETIKNEFIHWDMIDCFVNGELDRSDGHGFIGLGRKRMLQLLHDRAAELDVELNFEQEFDPEDINGRFKNADLIVAARDGKTPDHLLPTVRDGLEGVAFIDACVRSSKRDAAWVRL